MKNNEKEEENGGSHNKPLRKKTYTKARTRQAKAKKDALEVLRQTFGNVSMCCEKIGISRPTFYQWRADDPAFDAEVEAINERTLDFVESKMIQGIRDGNTRLIMFYLNCKGKKRGYGLKQESENGTSAITLRFSPEEADF